MNSSNSSDCSETADFQIYLLPITYCLVMVFGLLGNLGALYFFFFKMEQKSPSSAFVVSLAVADTIFLCALPFRIHYHLNGNDWRFGDVMCRITGTVFFGNIYISIAFMTCICLDRYIATIHPHTYLQLRNTRWALMVTVAVWVVTGTATLTFMMTCPLATDGSDGDQQDAISCFENFSHEAWRSSLMPYSAISLVFGALLPSLVILVCYPLVARRIARIKTATAKSALRIIYAILAITVLCFLPYHVVHLLHLLWRTNVINNCTAADVIYKIRRVTMALVSLNSLLDPVLYYFATGRCKWSFRWNLDWLKLKKTKTVYTVSDHYRTAGGEGDLLASVIMPKNDQ
ncbi:lysophosphatidic acid receptor 6-like [Astyanax mexicanus]|uniref:Lysophosphatidic acid receptor 6-like n=1 Tax=Astyanax mexicanus TaxID=7994 RepID=A0A8T2LBK4_ASTMX|nr:lysophosphatidic acid receptor 6-like [Astyanax mexicanus]